MHAPTSPWFLIETAPKVPRAELLLWSRDHDCWVVGYWDGEGWFAEAGDRLYPSAWAPLPGRPTANRAILIACSRGARMVRAHGSNYAPPRDPEPEIAKPARRRVCISGEGRGNLVLAIESFPKPRR